jgi:hypothetical protein
MSGEQAAVLVDSYADGSMLEAQCSLIVRCRIAMLTMCFRD